MFNLIYSPLANEDLTGIYNHIAADSPARAGEYLGKIEKCILRLKTFPDLGVESRYPELFNLGIKLLPFDNYLIFYKVNPNKGEVAIIRVLHGAVNYRSLFKNSAPKDNT